MGSPRSRGEWKAVLIVIKEYLGIDRKHRLSDYMSNVFVDVRGESYHSAI